MTGVIYLVIIALWAAVLIPVWLRRHDQISEVRSTARFSSAMKSLGSRGESSYVFEVSMPSAPSRSEAPAMRPTSRPNARPERADTARRPVRAMRPDARAEARRAAATRRATVLAGLTTLLAAVIVLAVFGMVAKWAVAVALVPVLVFVLASAMTSSSRSVARTPARPARRHTEEQVQAAVPTRGLMSDDEWENWNAWDDDSWEPVPTTLPTYVTAPRASAIPRGIDKAQPGEWTGSAMVETARAMRLRPMTASAEVVDHGADTAEMPAINVEEPRRLAANE